MSDYISREAAFKEFAEFVRGSNNSDFVDAPTWNDAVSLIGSLPAADVVTWEQLRKAWAIATADVAPVVHGKWIKDRLISTGGGTYGVYRCSVCEHSYQEVGYGFNYCPNCGARMDGGDHDA